MILLIVLDARIPTLTAAADGGGGRGSRRTVLYLLPVGVERIAWLVTVGALLVAALLLGLSGYEGYAALGVAVAGSAAINLF